MELQLHGRSPASHTTWVLSAPRARIIEAVEDHADHYFVSTADLGRP